MERNRKNLEEFFSVKRGRGRVSDVDSGGNRARTATATTATVTSERWRYRPSGRSSGSRRCSARSALSHRCRN